MKPAARYYLSGQTYDRRPELRRIDLHDRVNMVVLLLSAFAVGCGLVSVAGN
jgi:hypothetical protein